MFIDGQKSNHILDKLQPDERARLATDIERVEMPLGQVIQEAGAVQTHVYFPIDCIVSLLYVLANGDSAEVAIVGNDGLVGIPVITGSSRSPHRATVQAAGFAFRIPAKSIRLEF
ncbi:MAG: hypothetical protein ABIP02_07565 [Arenimonas sp.]